MPTDTNDDEDLTDSDGDELIEEIIHDRVTMESFLSMVETAFDDGDYLKIINLLPNSSQ
jgi:hypothetical protein